MDLSQLNSEQEKAVRCLDGRIRVVAGAGSGKTRALSYRYSYLVEEAGIDSSAILCLTFTNKAADEMRTRIRSLVDRNLVGDYICTIHGFCVRVLRKEIYRLGFPKTFQILDEEDAKSMCKDVIEEMGLERKDVSLSDVLEKIHQFKSQSMLCDAEPYIKTNMLPRKEPLKADADAVDRYMDKQVKSFSLEFDDLVYFTLYIFKNFPDALEFWQDQFAYVMVDECQDCNDNDWELLELVSGGCANLFVVGDPDQAIYEWRGARPGRFLNFRKDIDITLDINYRSTPEILSIANKLIHHNKEREEKDLSPVLPNGDKAIHYHAKDDKEEARFVAQEIARLISEGASASDFAVLYRASYLSRELEQALIIAHVNYVVWGGVRFYERKEIKDVLSFLRLMAQDDDLAFKRVLNVPSRKLGTVFQKRVREQAKKEGRSLYSTLKTHLGEPDFSRRGASDFVELVEKGRMMALCGDSVLNITNFILERSGLMAELRLDAEQERLENVNQLLITIAEYENAHREDNTTIDSFLQDISLFTNADASNEKDKVRLMTVHQAKGLEFPYVFIIGLSEGIFPSQKTIAQRLHAGEEEERRLMYVAITRAGKRLYLTESESANLMAGSNAPKLPSRFLLEISKSLFETRGKINPAIWKLAEDEARRINQSAGMEYGQSPRQGDGEKSQDGAFRKGQKVCHKIFGTGTVISYDESKDTYRVQFEKGARPIRAMFLSLAE